jgi:hypothetical protein
MTADTFVGIDWATDAKNRALVRLQIQGSDSQITLTELERPLDNAIAIKACKESSDCVVGVDIPFGWPHAFGDFVSKWTPTGTAAPPSSNDFRYRHTDLVVQRELQKWPLSVSADRIALGARSWIGASHGQSLQSQVDVLGEWPEASLTPRIIEVYPIATLKAFARRHPDFQIAGYKTDESVRGELWDAIINTFRVRLTPNIDRVKIIGAGAESDPMDAFIAAITGIIYAASFRKSLSSQLSRSRISEWRIRCPESDEEKARAKIEGWIFFPVQQT